MPLPFVLDEHLRGPFWSAIQRFNRRSEDALDVVRVGDYPEIPLGSSDSRILEWADSEGRIVITQDVNTMPKFLRERLATGQHSPGVVIIRVRQHLAAILESLQYASRAGFPMDYRDKVTFIP